MNELHVGLSPTYTNQREWVRGWQTKPEEGSPKKETPLDVYEVIK